MNNPPPENLSQATETIVKAAVNLITTDEEVRQALRTILQRVMEPDPSQPSTVIPPSTPTPAIPLIETIPTPLAPPTPTAPQVVGPDLVSPAPPPPSYEEQPIDRDDYLRERDHEAPNLSVIAKRAKLKAEACDWAIERRELLESGADHRAEISPTDTNLIGQARALPDCYLWMLHPYHDIPTDDLLENIAGCYENVAHAAELAERIIGDHDTRPPTILLYLIAEAQSALFAGLDQTGMYKDRDQLDLFKWLGDKTYAHRIFIKNHMKRDDPADYKNWEDLGDRLESFVEEKSEHADRERDRSQYLNKLNYHLGRLDAAAGDEEEITHQWTKITESLTDWVKAGFPPSDREIRDLLLPVIDNLPESITITTEMQRVFDAIDQFISDTENTEPDLTPPRPLSAEILQAAELLRGKVVVLIGGDIRPHAKAHLERDLELKELRWVPTRDHQHLSTLEPEIARDDVALVLLAIRWSSHMHGDLKPIADAHQKPFVRLPRGYGSSQVARELLQQVSDKLQNQPA